MKSFSNIRQGLSFQEAGRLGFKASICKRSEQYLDRINKYLKTPKLCKFCNSIIEYKYHKRNKFCSHSCAALFLNPFHTKPKRKCLNCDKEVKENKQTCCGYFCASEIKFKLLIDKWKQGLDLGYSGKAFQIKNFIRKYLFRKFNSMCQKCGWKELHPILKTTPLQVNHIDGNPANCQEENLELLCPNCHSLTVNFGRLNKTSCRIRKR